MPIHSKEERRGAIRRLRLGGSASLEEAMDFIANAIAECRDGGFDRLLITGCALQDVPVPTLVDRFLMVDVCQRPG